MAPESASRINIPQSRCSRESAFHQSLLRESFEHVPNLSQRGFLGLRDLSGAKYQVVYGQDFAGCRIVRVTRTNPIERHQPARYLLRDDANPQAKDLKAVVYQQQLVRYFGFDEAVAVQRVQ